MIATEPETAPPIACAAWLVPEVSSRLWLAWTNAGSLTHALWTGADEPAPDDIPGDTPQASVPDAIGELLRAYFAGEPVDPATLPIAPAGTAFQRKVWDALRAVGRGDVRSYAGIAADIRQPRAMRAVGMANSRNPIAVIVPCHRVVEKDFRIGGYTSGLLRKRFLLELEGVQIAGDVVRPRQLTLL